MKTLVAAVLCLCAVPAHAQNLRGQWQVDVPGRSSYIGTALVDSDGRVTFDSPLDAGRPAKYRGYVERGTAGGIKIVLTNGADVTLLYCAAELNDRLHCYASRASGSKSVTFLLSRVGPGPRNLMQAHQ